MLVRSHNQNKQWIHHILPQILRQWYWTLPLEYSVNDFIQEVKKWYQEGHLDEGVWDHLRTVVNTDIIPAEVVRKQTYIASGGGISPSAAPSTAEATRKKDIIPSPKGMCYYWTLGSEKLGLKKKGFHLISLQFFCFWCHRKSLRNLLFPIITQLW